MLNIFLTNCEFKNVLINNEKYNYILPKIKNLIDYLKKTIKDVTDDLNNNFINENAINYFHMTNNDDGFTGLLRMWCKRNKDINDKVMNPLKIIRDQKLFGNIDSIEDSSVNLAIKS